MDKYIVKIIKTDIQSQEYYETKYKPISVLEYNLLACDDKIETIAKYRYRMEKIKNITEEIQTVYIDDESKKFLTKIIGLTNYNINMIVSDRVEKIKKELVRKIKKVVDDINI